MHYWNGNQTYITTNCDAITTATCILGVYYTSVQHLAIAEL